MTEQAYKESIRRIMQVYTDAVTVKSGLRYTTVNEFSDQLPAVRYDTLEAALCLLMSFGPFIGNKLLCEEDKGAILAGPVSIAAKLPLAMARFYTYDLPSNLGSIVVPVQMEYAVGHLMVNGIEPGDRISIIDDTLASGGTAISLIQAVTDKGALVVEMRTVIEKIGFGGRERVLEAAGIQVQAAMGIAVDGDGIISIVEVNGRSVKEV